MKSNLIFVKINFCTKEVSNQVSLIYQSLIVVLISDYLIFKAGKSVTGLAHLL